MNDNRIINSKRIRQYMGLFFALAAYYLIHEGAHMCYALFLGVFQKLRFLGLGVQVDVYHETMSSVQLGIFCLAGPGASLAAGFLLVFFSKTICRAKSRLFKAGMYYMTLTMLLLDPLYLSILYPLFGGGDMNGIRLLIPEAFARLIFGCLFLANVCLLRKKIIPQYQKAFKDW